MEPPPRPPSPACDLRRISPTADPNQVLLFLIPSALLAASIWDGHVAHVQRAWHQHAVAVNDLAMLTRPDGPCTEGPPRGPDLGRAIAVNTRQPLLHFDAAHDLACLLANAESEGIAVTWFVDEAQIGGFVYRPRERQARRRDRSVPPAGLDARSLPAVTIGEHVIVLNPAQNFTTTFDVLLHEVAHVLFGHLGSREPVGRGSMRVPERLPPPRHHPREVEANLAAVLAGRRRGHVSRSIERLYVQHFAAAKAEGQLGDVDLTWVVPVADVLAAWCRTPPDPDAVRAVGEGPRVGPRVAVVG